MVMTDANCNASFGPLTFAVPNGQAFVTATATDPSNNTSEFSALLPPGRSGSDQRGLAKESRWSWHL